MDPIVVQIFRTRVHVYEIFAPTTFDKGRYHATRFFFTKKKKGFTASDNYFHEKELTSPHSVCFTLKEEEFWRK